MLGYFQVVWPLNRQPVPLPKDMSLWPSVDIFVPTYNEDLNVVKNTIYASLGIDWPKDKLNIWILDDGGREEFRQFAQNVGVKYIARTTHEHAKAGNINNALKYAKGEFVSIFDCDHVPTRSFLQMTMGWFLKEKQLAMMQIPHHFFSPDPFERNLGRFRKTPNEGTLFYGLVQDGNDMWDATFFCGSCAVIRRKPLDEIGGIAVETVTEDAHTSLRLHRRGYTSAYMRIPQAAGLATESLSAHIGQRIRWARGMVQIFRLDNPLTGKGLKFAQRLCYVNAMFHFLSGIPRLIFLTAPLAFLLLHAYIIYAPALMIALFVLPHMIHASLTNSKIQGKYRHSFWSEIYETVLAWYIAPPTLVALINPHKGKFNVTAKGGLVEEEYVDWVFAALHLPCSTQPGGRCGRHLALLLWPANRDAHRGRQYGVGVLQPDCSWRRSCGIGRKQTGTPIAPRGDDDARGNCPRRWSPLLVYRSGFLRRWFGDQDQRSGADSGRAESESVA